MHHKRVPVGQIHVPYQWQYADDVSRLAATDVLAEDIGKLARQLSDNSLWMLVGYAPNVWQSVAGYGDASPTSSGLMSATDKAKLNTLGTYIHTQSIASDTWTIIHDLGRYPSITVVDSSGNEVEGDNHYDSLNQVTITFSAAFGGEAYLN